MSKSVLSVLQRNLSNDETKVLRCGCNNLSGCFCSRGGKGGRQEQMLCSSSQQGNLILDSIWTGAQDYHRWSMIRDGLSESSSSGWWWAVPTEIRLHYQLPQIERRMLFEGGRVLKGGGWNFANGFVRVLYRSRQNRVDAKLYTNHLLSLHCWQPRRKEIVLTEVEAQLCQFKMNFRQQRSNDTKSSYFAALSICWGGGHP